MKRFLLLLTPAGSPRPLLPLTFGGCSDPAQRTSRPTASRTNPRRARRSLSRPPPPPLPIPPPHPQRLFFFLLPYNTRSSFLSSLKSQLRGNLPRAFNQPRARMSGATRRLRGVALGGKALERGAQGELLLAISHSKYSDCFACPSPLRRWSTPGLWHC